MSNDEYSWIPRRYFAQVVEVRSGDDIVLLVCLGHDDLYKKIRARLFGVDTPNAFKNPPEDGAEELQERIRSLLHNKTVVIDVNSMRHGSGGWLVTLYLDRFCNTSLNEILQSEGYIFEVDRYAA